MSFSEIKSQDVFDKALSLCRGTYQVGILHGHESLSGSTLRGRAKAYSGRYRASAANLLARCQAAGLPVTEARRKFGKRVVVIG